MRKIYLISLELSAPTAQVANEQAGYYKEAGWLQHMQSEAWDPDQNVSAFPDFSAPEAPPPTSLQPDDVVGLQEPVNGPAELCCPDQRYHCFQNSTMRTDPHTCTPPKSHSHLKPCNYHHKL